MATMQKQSAVPLNREVDLVCTVFFLRASLSIQDIDDREEPGDRAIWLWVSPCPNN